jgi:ATP-dependent helicase/nuclease subunit B
MVSKTRRDEARSVMALVAGLRERGVPIRDIVVVARDLDAYEEPLSRAAVGHDVAPVFWTQLRVTRTRPYALVESICDAVGDDEVDKRALLRPLEHRWTPPDVGGGDWPIEPQTIQRARNSLPEGALSLDDWMDVIDESDDADYRIKAFVHWLADAPDPHPSQVGSLLSDVVEAYAEHGLPETKSTDSPALLDTETEARAVVRVRTLVDQLPHKFADRLDEGALDRSWSAVAELANVIAKQRPGRREHSNARAVDVLEANDVWALDIPYVIAVGLTASEWPDETASPIRSEFQEAVLRGDGETSKLAPDASWIDARDRDHLADTLRAAANGVIVTRHAETVSGDRVYPSPFLEFFDADAVPDTELEQLRSTDRALPASVRTMLSDEGLEDRDD